MSSKESPRAHTQFDRLPVARFMERDVQYAYADTRADKIASMMVEGFGAVPIVDQARHLIGIISEYDLLASLEKGHKWGDLPAGDVMTKNPYSVRPETDVATLIHVLRASDLIRVPVVDAKGVLVGVVARRDLVRAYLNYGAESSPPS
ncbi:CBS domain-containing protein [Candidatus Nitrospira bockiana]